MVWQIAGSDTGYPRKLQTIADPPGMLYFRGDIHIINGGRNIAVIGSRHISGSGIKYAYETGSELAKRGIHVVNGLALGCDTHALKGALSAGGKCIAVMPCGLDKTVPGSNTRLADEIVSKGGCLISEYPMGSVVQKYQYVMRDRLQSGISDGVIVVEAGEGSGTMHTVKYCIRQGRALACIASRFLQHASGNRWIEGQKEAKVIGSIGELDCFLDGIYGNAYLSFGHSQ